VHLITFSDKRTHKKDKVNIFLDERLWLCNVQNKHLNIDYIIAKPYGLGNKKVKKDYLLKKQLTKKIFPILCMALNQFHDTDYNGRYWKIVVGHWLDKYLSVMINRVGSIEQCLSEYPISSTTIIPYDESAMVKNDLASFISACDDELWNHYLYQYIINNLNIDIDKQIIFEHHNKVQISSKTPNKRKIIDLIYRAIFNILNIFSRKDDGVIINSYMPKMYEAKFCLSLGQVPLFLRTKGYCVTKDADCKLRNDLSSKISVDKKNSIEYISQKLLFRLLPVCYLEGFSEMNQATKSLPWPKSPKFIFTSNSFHSDEVFKLWTANKIINGSIYYIGQHGNNYGTSKFLNPSIEEDISDIFLTWGWSNNKKETPAFVFKLLGKNINYNPSGGVLLVQEMMYKKYTTWDGAAHFSKYMNNLFLFVKGLNLPIRNSLTVRLHNASREYDYSEKRWNDFNNKVVIDPGIQSIDKKIKESRLIIHGYDSTGLLETLAQNIPTLALLNYGSYGTTGIAHVQDSAKPYYDLLINAGIIHLTAESLYKQVNSIFDSVESWWNQDYIQDARITFCEKYAKKSTNPINDLKCIVKSNYNI
jgi:putative transferase (TIGR04331 family)